MNINPEILSSHISHEYVGGERIENLMISFPLLSYEGLLQFVVWMAIL